jgi:hypothetical protein
MILRRARGYAPLPIATKSAIGNRQSAISLAVGAHLKKIGNRQSAIGNQPRRWRAPKEQRRAQDR